MNETQKAEMWEVPLGSFNSAIQKLAKAVGNRFGGFVWRLNNIDTYPGYIAEAIFEPDIVFVRRLLKSINSPYSLEELQSSLELEDQVNNARLFGRIFDWAKVVFIDFNEDGYKYFWQFQDNFLRSVFRFFGILRNPSLGFFILQNLVFELNLRKAIYDTPVDSDHTIDWVVLEGGFAKVSSLEEIVGLLGSNFKEILSRATAVYGAPPAQEVAKSLLAALRNQRETLSRKPSA